MPTHDEIRAMSTTELERFLNTAGYGSMDRNLAMEELTRRRLRPHWTRLWTFVAAVVTVILAAIAAIPVILDFFQSAPIVDKSANSPQPKLQQAPSEPQAPKTSASSDHPSEPPESKSITKER
jgi:hypothetical protein